MLSPAPYSRPTRRSPRGFRRTPDAAPTRPAASVDRAGRQKISAFTFRKAECVLSLPRRRIRFRCVGHFAFSLSEGQDFFIWIRCNPLKSPDSAKGFQGNPSYFAWIYLVLLGFHLADLAHIPSMAEGIPPGLRPDGEPMRHAADGDRLHRAIVGVEGIDHAVIAAR
jgi:hypothetical protein